LKILVTGASGFIGKHLVKDLAPEHVVYALSRQKKLTDELSACIDLDLTSINFEEKLPGGIECVIHLAQSGGYRDFPNSAHDMFEVNVTATHRLLEWARVSQVRHFIFASTANVYSSSSQLLNEESPATPDSFYGATKLSAEHIARQYQQFFQVDILRLFTVYGPGQRNMLIPTIIDRIKSGSEITLANGVGIYLTPIYVGDVVKIFKELLNLKPIKKCRLMNICGDDIINLSDIVTQLGGIIGKKALVKRTDEVPRYFIGSSQHMKDKLCNAKLKPLKDGLALTIFASERLY
jgi:nucleoside-diphosphate-sugar epimerase